MPSESAARTNPLSNPPDDGDYQVFCEALSASARGRAFLAEYTRRNRNADTEQLLSAIELQSRCRPIRHRRHRSRSDRNCAHCSTDHRGAERP
jgi:hypothetical protein